MIEGFSECGYGMSMKNKYNFDYDFERAERNKKISSFILSVFRWMIEIAFVISLAYLLVVYTVEQTDVLGSSMEPTLTEGNTIIINKLAFHKEPPTRYDLIVFRQGGDEHMYYDIKRVIAVPGETIQIIDGEIYITSPDSSEPVMLLEPYIVEPMLLAGFAAEPVTLDEDEYFVLGDNRNNSEDSRFSTVGNVTKEDIVGMAWLRLKPFSLINKSNKDYVRPTPTPLGYVSEPSE